MRLSRLGIALCLVYVLPTIMCIGTGLFCSDTKSSFIFLQLPIAFQLGALNAMGWNTWLPPLSWAGAYLMLGAPIVLMLYFLGYWLSRIFTGYFDH